MLFVVQGAWAQNASRHDDGRRVYRKSSGDSVRLRVDTLKKKKTEKKKKKSYSAVRKGKSKSVKRDSLGVDSLRYSQKQYAFGDRIIMRGDSGRDVRKLAEILINNLYIEDRQILYTPTGDVLYDGELLKAVKRFQEYNGFYPDGIVGFKLIKVLKKL